MKVLCVCGNGLGSSLIVKMNAAKVFKELGVKANIKNCDLASAKSDKADLYIGDKNIVKNITNGNVILLDRVADKAELNTKISDYLNK